MSGPAMSGHCQVADQQPIPANAHARCRLEGCVCACHTPAELAVPDDLEPAGEQLALAAVDPVVGDLRLELTLGERAAVVAAHAQLNPGAALEVARRIAQERMMAP